MSQRNSMDDLEKLQGWNLSIVGNESAFFLALVSSGLRTKMPMTIRACNGHLKIKLGKITIAQGKSYQEVRDMYTRMMAELQKDLQEAKEKNAL